MNRRNFFKAVTGFVAGIFFVPKVLAKKPELTLAKLMMCKNELDAREVSDDFLIPVDEDWTYVVASYNGKGNFDDANKPEVTTKIFNGQVFEAPWPLCHRVVVQYFGEADQWLLMSDPYETSQCNGTAMMVCYYARKDGSYNPFYTQRELQEKLKDWKLVEDVRLTLV